MNNRLFRNEPSSLEVQNQVLKVLQGLSVADALGAACAFMLHCAHNHRTEFRRVMNEKVVPEGFSGVSLLDVFKRVSQ